MPNGVGASGALMRPLAPAAEVLPVDSNPLPPALVMRLSIGHLLGGVRADVGRKSRKMLSWRGRTIPWGDGLECACTPAPQFSRGVEP